MKETKKKSPWRFAFLACTVYGAVKLLPALYVNILYWILPVYMDIRSKFVPNEAYSIGIIGGADGPTAVFVTAPVWMQYILPVLLLVTGIAGLLYLRRKEKE